MPNFFLGGSLLRGRAKVAPMRQYQFEPDLLETASFVVSISVARVPGSSLIRYAKAQPNLVAVKRKQKQQLLDNRQTVDKHWKQERKVQFHENLEMKTTNFSISEQKFYGSS